MKTVYFVRHGESETNAGNVQGASESPLTEKGRKQAEFIARRAEALPIEVVVSSTYTRAVQTAEIIKGRTGKGVVHSDLFVERRRPSEQIGLRKDSSEWRKIEREVVNNFAVPGWRYSDEENLEDLIERAGQALSFLVERSEEHILVVTHGGFMRVVAAQVLMGKKCTLEVGDRFMKKFHMANTGLSVIRHDETEQSKDSPWFLWIWNDHAHLGE